MAHRILIGDCRSLLRTIKPNTIHCVITSPPYFGLRDYGVTGQLGLEPDPNSYVQNLVAVFQEVRRVLRDDGTCWLNLGDTYASAWACNRRSVVGAGSLPDGRRAMRPNRLVEGLKEKDLLGIPWRVALALQQDGWYLRQDIIWHKPNPMPESVRDRCTKSHEYIFLLTKSANYYFDNEAIKEPVISQKGNARSFRGGGAYTAGQAFDNSALIERETVGNTPNETGMRNKRSVWTVASKPFKEAHFATFPPALIEPCVLAGSPVHGIVLDPFAGAGTTGVVAKQHNRHFVGIELNPAYAEMAERRIANTP